MAVRTDTSRQLWRWLKAGYVERRLRRQGIEVEWKVLRRPGSHATGSPTIVAKYVDTRTGKLVLVVN